MTTDEVMAQVRAMEPSEFDANARAEFYRYLGRKKTGAMFAFEILETGMVCLIYSKVRAMPSAEKIAELLRPYVPRGLQ